MDSIIIEKPWRRDRQKEAIRNVSKALNEWLKERGYHFLTHSLSLKRFGINRVAKKVTVEYIVDKRVDIWELTAAERRLVEHGS